MFYMELYVYDYLKKQEQTYEDCREEIELWGEKLGGNIFISELRMPGEKKPFYKPSMQYLGNFWKIQETEKGEKELTYLKEGELQEQEILLYTAKETEGMEHFLIYASGFYDGVVQEKDKGNLIPFPDSSHKGLKKALRQPPLKAAEITETEKTEEKNKSLLLQIVSCIIVIFLLGNMIDALRSYENMQDVLEVIGLLMKSLK